MTASPQPEDGKVLQNPVTFELTSGTQTVAVITAILGGLIVVLSLYYYFSSMAAIAGGATGDRLAAAKDIFDDTVDNTLVPIFKTLIAAVLGWVFGKPMVASIADRIRSARANVPLGDKKS